MKVGVPAAVGVPESTTVPAPALWSGRRGRQPRAAGEEAGIEGRIRPVPPETVIVWLVAVPAVAAASAGGARSSAGPPSAKRSSMRVAPAVTVTSTVNSPAGCRRSAGERHRSRRRVRREVRKRQSGRASDELGDREDRIGQGVARHRDHLVGRRACGGVGERRGRMLSAGIAPPANRSASAAPAVSVTLTLKVAVPAPLGVPASVTVPAVASVVRLAAVDPVVPALNPEMLNVVSSLLPSDTVIVWLVAVPGVASASAAGAMTEPRIDRQRERSS